MGLIQTVAPTTEPITLAEAKLHLRVDSTDEDTLIESLISVARDYVEKRTGRQLVNATWAYRLNEFPASCYIRLPIVPLVSIESVEYIDSNGETQTFTDYETDTYSEPGRIVLAYNYDWPTIRDTSNAVTITFVAGYGEEGSEGISIPDAFKSMMKLYLANLYENREATISGTIIAEVPQALESLISLYSIRGFN